MVKLLVTLVYIHQTIDVIGIKGYVDKPDFKSPDTIRWALLTIVYIGYLLGVGSNVNNSY